MAEASVRFEVGFVGGGATSGQADADALRSLEEALETGQDKLVVLEHEGTRLLVRSSQIGWLRVHGGGKRVGF
jgi:hypothetical protein